MEKQKGILQRRLVIDFSVYYSILPPLAASPPGALLIALHGYGQRCERFAQIFSLFQEKGILVVAPQAPNQFYLKLDPKIVGFTWLTRYERDQSIQDFLGYMNRLLENLHTEFGFDWRQIFFLGFSQGVSMAYRYAISGKYPLAGLIACGADLPPDVTEKLPGPKPMPILLVHGREDSVVPVNQMREAEKILTANSFPVQKCLFPGDHEIPEPIVEKIADWILEIVYS